MGALHAAHLSLIKKAQRECDRIITSIFVNPAQFGPREDFKHYPRPLQTDTSLCRASHVDALFLPSQSSIYPTGYKTYIEVQDLSAPLCGRFRPGHFRGVATVVHRLLSIVCPDRLYLGEKDFQQLCILRRMARDMGHSVRIVACKTLRESDGLALSSRNAYLSPRERSYAPQLYNALCAGKCEAQRRGATPASVRACMRREIRTFSHIRIDYMEIVDAHTLKPPSRLKGAMRLLGAIHIGQTRLIDNIPLRM